MKDGRSVVTIFEEGVTEYIVTHRFTMATTGTVCEKCSKEFWTHSDSPGQLFTLGGMYQDTPLLTPHWYPCADGWD